MSTLLEENSKKRWQLMMDKIECFTHLTVLVT
jgi:hypothetical protein